MTEESSAEEAQLRARYQAMSGSVPDMVAARIGFVGELAPQFQVLTKALRADALDNAILDARAAPLLLFGLLLRTRPHGAAGTSRLETT